MDHKRAYTVACQQGGENTQKFRLDCLKGGRNNNLQHISGHGIIVCISHECFTTPYLFLGRRYFQLKLCMQQRIFFLVFKITFQIMLWFLGCVNSIEGRVHNSNSVFTNVSIYVE
jgi:hypothetical protein